METVCRPAPAGLHGHFPLPDQAISGIALAASGWIDGRCTGARARRIAAARALDRGRLPPVAGAESVHPCVVRARHEPCASSFAIPPAQRAGGTPAATGPD